MTEKTICEYQIKECEETLKILGHAKMPNDKVLFMLGYINQKIGEGSTTDDTPIKILISYAYGRMNGVRSEREVCDWNAHACFHNMKAYASQHNGNLPESYDLLMQWVKNHD